MLKMYLILISLAANVLLPGLAEAQQVKKIKMDELMVYAEKADHPVIINVWATWCAPCVEELPWFDKMLRQYQDSNIELILVSLDFADRYEKAIDGFLQKHPLNATLFWLDETNADYFCPMLHSNWTGNIPVTLFINNKTGYRKFFDDQVKEEELETTIQEMLQN